MVQRGRRLGLAMKTRDLRCVRIRRQQDLDRDLAIELGVLREKHLAHPAGANLLDDPVVCDTLPDHFRNRLAGSISLDYNHAQG